MKVAINKCFGGFGLSAKAEEELEKLTEKEIEVEVDNDYFGIDSENEDEWRTHPLLIQVIEELGMEADGSCASLNIIEIPDAVSWHISSYDGSEHIAEDHRTWC